ncbi:MAG: DNA polymerase III subunit delta [Rhodospirillaceae bacterium]|nr:DNA polymerase III subunit delta [Rhodospirillaceae bacterium]
MRIPPARLAAFLRAPDPAVAAVLLYGPDQGAVLEHGAALRRAILGDGDDPFRFAEFAASDLQKDPPRLADEFGALALTGGRRVVRVREAGDGLTDAVADAVGLPGDALIVVEAGDLPARSRLRKLFEGAANLASIGCYAPEGEALARLVDGWLAADELRLTPGARDLLLDRLAADRALAHREVEKLALYAAGKGQIAEADVAAVVGDGVEPALDDIVDAALTGNPVAADAALDRFFAGGGAAVAAIRAMLREMLRLHRVRSAEADGAGLQAAIAALQPKVWPNQQGAFRRRLERWPLARLDRALARLGETEALTKRTGHPADTICRQAVLSLAVLAGRR